MTAQGGVFTSASSEVERLKREVERLKAALAAETGKHADDMIEAEARLAKVVEALEEIWRRSLTGQWFHEIERLKAAYAAIAAAQQKEEHNA